LSLAYTVLNLNYCISSIQREFVPWRQIAILIPVCIAHEVSTIIVYHDPLVECVVFQFSVLPSFLLTAQVVRE
jgi:hypothetical protein